MWSSSSIAFIQDPGVRETIRSHPEWSEAQKLRLLALLEQWKALHKRYRHCEYRLKIQQLEE